LLLKSKNNQPPIDNIEPKETETSVTEKENTLQPFSITVFFMIIMLWVAAIVGG
jgi:hypothetical protein